MDEKRIEFIERVRHDDWVTVQDEFRFEPNGYTEPLQRFALWFLMRCGALQNAMVNRTVFTRRTIDAPKFMERLYKQRRALFSYLDRDGQRLLIGSEDFAQLMDETALDGQYTFSAEWIHRRTVMNLHVQIIPWMRGMLVMP